MAGQRGPRSVRNPQYSAGGGGSGGGFGALLGALLGSPVATEGVDPSITGDNALALQGAGEENATGLSDYPSSTGISRVVPPNMEKPGFFQNMLTRGGAGQQYAAFQNQSALAGYHNQLQQKLLQERLAGEGAMKGDLLSKANAFRQQEDQSKQSFESSENRAQELAALNQLAAKEGFGSWETYKQILDNPDLMTAGLKNIYANREKQGFDNAETQAKTQEIIQGKIPYQQAQTDEIRAAIPTKRFLPIPEGAAVFNPETSQVVNNFAPQKEKPEVRGGVSSYNLPSYSGGSFAKVPGGVNSEFSNSRGVPPMLARPSEPVLPKFDFPSSKPSLTLPPGYEPYRDIIESQQPTIPAPPQPVTPKIFPLDANAQLNPVNSLLELFRRKRPGMPQQFNPYSGYGAPSY